ncbi:hypothetical protein BCR44DRAFT_1510442 [Catenaria anguillulae PL171]|uniref:Uncharacterized protein n=1 Tax=Catenaria anguillulae PL171 TaxID=765915 RepID=A0A1Y2HYR6_9FUNG|nr:hypothetical protein BCR44DRAFT_1510442 [Catenaria anguillulae PL171]
MMTAAAPPDTHTLILLQLEPNAPSSRTYLEHPSTSAAILDLISMFEHKLRQDQTSSSSASTSSTLKYTDMDVTSYIDSFPEIACLIRNPLPGGVSAYVPKDKEWIKQFVRPVLLQKLQSMRAAEAASLAGAGAESVSTLASRMSMNSTSSSSNNVPAHQAQNQNQQSQKRQSQRNPRDSLSPPPRAASSSKSSNKTANAAKKQQQPTSKILVASASKPGKITKRLGPDGAKAAQLSTQLFTKAYAEKKGLAHVTKPLPAGVSGAGGAKRGGGGGGGGESASGKRGGGGRR